MKLLGEWNWYLPRWLEWLPTLAIESRRAPQPASDAATNGAVVVHARPCFSSTPTSARRSPSVSRRVARD